MKRIAVLGGGVAGLAAAWELESSHPSCEVLLLESSPRLGGLVETEHTRDGFLLEHGPDALLTRKPVTKQLLEGLDLASMVSMHPAWRPAPRRTMTNVSAGPARLVMAC